VIGSIIEENLDQLSPAKEPIRVRFFAATLHLPIENESIKDEIRSGAVLRKMTTDSLIQTSMSMTLIADAWILSLPGDPFPEQVVGGLINPAESDYRVESFDRPTLRGGMRGRTNFVSSRAGDYVGPIVPLSLWDSEAPFHDGIRPTEETRALGPMTGRLLHRGYIAIMRSTMQLLKAEMDADTSQARTN
jgi:hypothetical protein